MVWRRPPRNTAAFGASMSRIASSDFSAFPSCTNPMIALITITADITPVSTQWPRLAVTAAATMST